MSFLNTRKTLVCSLVIALCLVPMLADTAHAWEPTKPITVVIPYARGGADVIGRFIQSVVGKYNFSNQPLVVINKDGGSGVVGMQYLRNKKGDPHYFMVSLSSIVTTPLHTNVGFTWRDLTPFCRLALDRHALCISTKKYPDICRLDQFLKLAKEAEEKGELLQCGGTGVKQEDQIVMLMLEKATGVKIKYIPMKSGGEVAKNLVGGHIDLSMNNPSEFIGYTLSGDLKQLVAFDKKRVIGYINVPTMPELGYPDATYQMLRGLFMAPGVKPEHIEYMTELIKKVIATPEWQGFLTKIMLDGSEPLFGEEFAKWMEEYDALHEKYMREGGLID
jgi:tripartite-type tricarboxylate transporter receptor subunit TctC